MDVDEIIKMAREAEYFHLKCYNESHKLVMLLDEVKELRAKCKMLEEEANLLADVAADLSCPHSCTHEDNPDTEVCRNCWRKSVQDAIKEKEKDGKD